MVTVFIGVAVLIFILYTLFMLNKYFIRGILPLLLGVFLFGCVSSGSLRNVADVTLTVFDTKNLLELLPQAMPREGLVWTSSNPLIASVTQDGVVRALNISNNRDERFVSGPGTGNAIITASTEDGNFEQSFTVKTTTAAIRSIMDLPPMKEQFADFFLIGNIVGGHRTSPDITGTGANARITNEQLLRHFNVLTAENQMKPDSVSGGSRNNWTWQHADTFVYAAYNSGFKVVGHTLLWHSQIPTWQRNMARQNREQALPIMREFITEVVSRYAGRIYSWDVLNEIIPDGVVAGMDWRTSMRGSGVAGDNQGPNPWFASIGYDFVYYGFLAARQADPNAILYYNDYNTDQLGKASLIRDMVRDVNERYLREHGAGGTRLLIERIGIQEHHNIGVPAANVRRSIDMFRAIGVEVSVTELDVLGQGWSAFQAAGGAGTNQQGTSTVTNQGLIYQARRFYEYMLVYLENADIINRVSFWGIQDDRSWRSRGLPMLFDSQGRAKPGYFALIMALEDHLAGN